jgi:hypothetical protein
MFDPDFLDFLSEPRIADLASHFYELQLTKIPVSALVEILASYYLRLSSENDLYDSIVSHYRDHREYLWLLRFVRFEYLSPDRLYPFISLISERISEIGRFLWDSICCRLIPRIAVHNSPSLRDSMEGVISYLTRIHGGNVHDKGVVQISSKSVVFGADSEYGPRNLADLTSDSEFRSTNARNEWVCWDFGTFQICPTHYLIRPASVCFLQSWIIEISMDGVFWEEVDRQDKNMDLSQAGLVHVFPISTPRSCRFIRLIQTGKNAYRNNLLALCAFDVFETPS